MLRIDDIPQQVADDIQGLRLDLFTKVWYNILERSDIMAKNYLLIYSEQLATEIELLCQNIKAPSNTLFQIRKSSSSVHANIREANYAHGKADFIAKLQIALKECYETEYWLELFVKSEILSMDTAKDLYNQCGTIRRMLIASINTAKGN